MIIITDFMCWVPFIVVCGLHYLSVFDATPWYSLFSLVVLPINSLINPLLYNEEIAKLLGNVCTRLITAAVIGKKFIRRKIPDLAVEVTVETAGSADSPAFSENGVKDTKI